MPPPARQDRAAQRAERAERDEKILRGAIAGMTCQQLADKFGVGRSTANTIVRRGLAELTKKRDIAAEDLRSKHIALLDEALAVAHEIMRKDHLAHGNGRIVRREIDNEDGARERPDGTRYDLVDVLDDGPKLAAADRLIKISESQRKLLGLDAPDKVEQQIDGTVNYVINVEPGELDQL